METTYPAIRRLRIISLMVGWSFLVMGVLSVLCWFFSISFAPLTLIGIIGINALGVNELKASARLKGEHPKAAGKRLMQNQIFALIYMVGMILPLFFLNIDKIMAEWQRDYPQAVDWLRDMGGVMEMDIRQTLWVYFRLTGAILLLAVVPVQTLLIFYYRSLTKKIPETVLPLHEELMRHE